MVEKREPGSPAARQRQAAEMEAKLFRAVGEFVLAFSDAEAWTHACIALLCDEPRVRKMAGRDWEFERRRAFLVSLADKRVVPESLRQDWLHVWSRAQELARKRDLLAQGTLAGDGDVTKRPEQQNGVTSFRQLFRDPVATSRLLSEVESHLEVTRNLVRDIGELSPRIAACPARVHLRPIAGG
jgi:hypothetical protein